MIHTINQELLNNSNNHNKNIEYPNYSRDDINCGIVHIGVGGFHRSHQALYIHKLMQEYGDLNWGICGIGIMPQDEKIEHTLKQQDCLYTLVEQNNTTSTAKIIGSIKEYIWGYKNPHDAFNILSKEQIKLVTITATEAGYYLLEDSGELNLEHDCIQHDINNLNKPKTIFGYLAVSLENRRKNSIKPFTILSCDNMEQNGHILQKALIAFCTSFNKDLAEWIDKNVSFPSCMVDRITPITTQHEKDLIEQQYNIKDETPVVCEPFIQWVIEDNFCNARPNFEKVGVQFTTNVALYEKMKIRLLNATHSAMGYLGYLCGHNFIYEIAQDKKFIPYLRNMMDIEVTPLLQKVEGVDFEEYKQVLMHRFANEKIKDQALRICMDGSGKIPKYILPSIIEQLKLGNDKAQIRRLTLCVASWIRFLNGIDEHGKKIPIIDPQATRLNNIAKQSLNNPLPILECKDIFGNISNSDYFVKELSFLLNMVYENGAISTLEFCQ